MIDALILYKVVCAESFRFEEIGEFFPPRPIAEDHLLQVRLKGPKGKVLHRLKDLVTLL